MTAKTCYRCRADVTRVTLVRCKDTACPMQREREVATAQSARFAAMFLTGGLILAALVAAVGYMMTRPAPTDRSAVIDGGGFASARAPTQGEGWLAKLTESRQQGDGAAASQVVSFSCSDASAGARRLVCGSPELAQFDYNLGLVYESVVARAPDPAKVEREQRRWLAELDALGDDSAAIAEHYRRRLAELTRA